VSIGTSTFTARLLTAPATVAATDPATAAAIVRVVAAIGPAGVDTAAVIAVVEVIEEAAAGVAERIRG
jgi:predicted ATP-grasp superfamily ATP-dependent carboligase